MNRNRLNNKTARLVETNRAKRLFTIGVDEVGRGPVAGPVTVCSVMITGRFNTRELRGIKDSKQLSEKKREEWHIKAREWKSDGKLSYKVSSVSPKVIDKIGISHAVKLAVKRSLKGFDHKKSHVKLDGLLYAPERFTSQETIIKGDQKEKLISLASVIAKVERDKQMIRFSKRHPEYGFDQNKGYGTKKHKKAIKKYGMSTIHRRSFLTK